MIVTTKYYSSIIKKNVKMTRDELSIFVNNNYRIRAPLPNIDFTYVPKTLGSYW